MASRFKTAFNYFDSDDDDDYDDDDPIAVDNDSLSYNSDQNQHGKKFVSKKLPFKKTAAAASVKKPRLKEAQPKKSNQQKYQNIEEIDSSDLDLNAELNRVIESQGDSEQKGLETPASFIKAFHAAKNSQKSTKDNKDKQIRSIKGVNPRELIEKDIDELSEGRNSDKNSIRSQQQKKKIIQSDDDEVILFNENRNNSNSVDLEPPNDNSDSRGMIAPQPSIDPHGITEAWLQQKLKDQQKLNSLSKPTETRAPATSKVGDLESQKNVLHVKDGMDPERYSQKAKLVNPKNEEKSSKQQAQREEQPPKQQQIEIIDETQEMPSSSMFKKAPVVRQNSNIDTDNNNNIGEEEDDEYEHNPEILAEVRRIMEKEVAKQHAKKQDGGSKGKSEAEKPIQSKQEYVPAPVKQQEKKDFLKKRSGEQSMGKVQSEVIIDEAHEKQKEAVVDQNLVNSVLEQVVSSSEEEKEERANIVSEKKQNEEIQAEDEEDQEIKNSFKDWLQNSNREERVDVNCVTVYNLDPFVEERILYELFLNVGQIKRMKLFRISSRDIESSTYLRSLEYERNRRPHKKKAEIEYNAPYYAEHAIEVFDGIKLYGRPIYVQKKLDTYSHYRIQITKKKTSKNEWLDEYFCLDYFSNICNVTRVTQFDEGSTLKITIGFPSSADIKEARNAIDNELIFYYGQEIQVTYYPQKKSREQRREEKSNGKQAKKASKGRSSQRSDFNQGSQEDIIIE